MKRLAIAAVGLALVVGLAAVVVAVWASVGEAPWERPGTAPPSPSLTPAPNLTAAEAVDVVASKYRFRCGSGSPDWKAAYAGDGFWQVAACCVAPADRFDSLSLIWAVYILPVPFPEDAFFPIWGVRDSTERVAPLNNAARDIPRY